MYFAIVNPSIFNGANAKENINGEMPIILQPAFGTLPYNRIIDGTIAKKLGLTPGKAYLVTATLVDNVNPATGLVRKQLQVVNQGEVTAVEMIKNRRDFIDQMGIGKVEGQVTESTATNPSPEVKEEVPATEGEEKF